MNNKDTLLNRVTKRFDRYKQQLDVVVTARMDCPQCGVEMGSVKGTRDAVCRNCGYKEPCCE